MTSNRSFFESPQAAAIYKHKLLKSYIPAWVGKVGSRSSGQRVVVYDAYSGPGRYDDKRPGSPELLVDTAQAMASLRSVLTIFSEKDQTYCDDLEGLLRDKGVDSATYQVRRGPVETHVDDVLREAGNLPLFVFLDPYGLTVSFDQVVHILTSRDQPGRSRLMQPKTELLMNFSYEAIRRISGVVRSDREYAAKRGQIEALDAALGGDWWQELAREQPEGWVQLVLVGYADRVQDAIGGGYITADVADALDVSPVYELILFTRHMDGFWEMGRSMSMARKEWRQWLVDVQEGKSSGQVELRGLQFDDDEAAWVDHIAGNVTTLLAEKSGFTVQDEYGRVFGETVGLARETHLRQALRAISDLLVEVPKGSLQKAYIARR